MNDLRLSARLHDLDTVLTWPGETPSAESAIALHHRRRRTRAGVIATVVAVVAIAAGVPTAIGSLSSSGNVADPSPSVERSTSAPRTTTAVAPPAAATAPTTTYSPDPVHEAELAEVAAVLPPVSLTSPALWDQWLPEGKPYPGADLEDDLSTCPVLSARLAAVTGQEMSYWTGTLPNGPLGCTWVEIPLSGQDNDYDYVISVGYLADGTTVEFVRQSREGPGAGTRPCPSTDVPSVADGAVLARCGSSGVTVWTLAVPDTRLTGGLWVLHVQSKDSTPVRPAEILPVLVDGVVAAFG